MSQSTHIPSTRAPRILTVIVNYRTPEMTLRAAEAARHAMTDLQGQIVIVDNGSGDGSFAHMHAHVATTQWQNVTVLDAGHNGGFGAGNNHGILAAVANLPTSVPPPDYVYLLNSDAFPAADALRALSTHMQANPEVGFAGSLIHGEAGEAHQTAFRFPSLLGEIEAAMRFGPISRLLARHRIPLPVSAHTTRVDWVAGASVMMRMDMLHQIGLFDETFFLYFEETDLCKRGQKAGYHTDFVPHSQVMHIGSVSTGMQTWQRTPQYWFQSRWHYWQKHHGRLTALTATGLHVIAGLFHRARQGLKGRKSVDPDHFLRDMMAHDLKAALHASRSEQIATLPSAAPTTHPSDKTDPSTPPALAGSEV